MIGLVALCSLGAAAACERPAAICSTPSANAMALVENGRPAPVYADNEDYPGVLRAARNLQADLGALAGRPATLKVRRAPRAGPVIIVGTLGRNGLIDRLVREGKLDVRGVAGVWEGFVHQVVERPAPGVERALVIAGADKRGTIFGIYDLTERMGVSPWTWWADAPIRRRPNLYVAAGRRADAPAVRYRGIFLNDENPALYGWANEKFGGFNRRFYERVFELILRLKGNLLWPAMWGKAIYDDDPQSPELADEMGVVIGTSHHEPMMRAHVEWERYGGGTPWDYSRNEDRLRAFWRRGVERMGDNESIVTIGMRGDGDEPMTQGTAIALLERIVRDQRQILGEVTREPASATPQIWALYKEVQDYYDQGMQVPEDVTLLFSDDNWGNIRRLPEPGRERPGGYGVYYHFDYVGGPRSYKWINTNQIERVWEQMHLAHAYGADRLWIANVGDLKPMEFPIDFFLDYAWNPDVYPLERLRDYPRAWAAEQFGEEHAAEVGELLTRYAQYNSRRKPELLDPDTYSLVNSHEAGSVLNAYSDLAERAERVRAQLPPAYQDAFFQLVQYPIAASANLHELYVMSALNRLYAEQGRAGTNAIADRVEAAFARDAELTRQFHTLGAGRWNHMMDQTHIGYTDWQQPDRNTMPPVRRIQLAAQASMGVAVDGDERAWPGAPGEPVLPELSPYSQQTRSLDVFDRGTRSFDFTVTATPPWLRLTRARGPHESRVDVNVDWSAAPPGRHRVPIIVRGAGATVTVHADIFNPPHAKPVLGFVEANGYVAMEAEHYARSSAANGVSWQTIPNLGRTLSGVQAFPVTSPAQTPGGDSARLEYDVHLFNAGEVEVQVTMAPTMNFTGRGLRYAVSIDDEPPQGVNVHVRADGQMMRSGERDRAWETMVANNANVQTTRHRIARPGAHIIKLWLVDPGLVFERIVVVTGELPPSYLGPPESARPVQTSIAIGPD